MPRTVKVPIRYKILLAVLLVVTAVVSTITFTMAQMFHADKRIYMRDLSSMHATRAAQGAAAVLESYRDRLDVCARLLEDSNLTPPQRNALVQDVLSGLRGFVSISAYARGRQLAAVYDPGALEALGITAADIEHYRAQHPLPFKDIEAGRMDVENSSVGKKLPILTIAIAHRKPGATPLVLVAVLRGDELMGLATGSKSLNVYIVDGHHELVSYAEPAQVISHTIAKSISKYVVNSAVHVREYSEDGTDKIVGYAPVAGTELIAVAEIPASVASFASQSLLGSLLIVALLLLAAAAVVSMIWSQKLTASITRLLEATREIAQGHFKVDVKVHSSDEIGALSDSFNQMARELHHRERALKDAEGQLIQSEKMAAFGQLGAGVAHEIKNPLAGILGLIQLLRRKTYEDPDINEGLGTMEKETRRCRSIIDNLLRFARQEKVGLSPVDVGAIITDAVAIMRHQLALNEVILEQSVPESLPPVAGNANQLQQVLMNLVLNAQQAMHGKPGEVMVEAKATRDGYVAIRVRDNGSGIPKDIQSRIFEPFFTTKPSGQGTGLGLSVSYGIVQEHKGTIRVESAPGAGTTFVIELPVAVAQGGEDASQTALRAA